MAKEKVFTIEQQLERMNELHGVGIEDATNVFSAFKKTMETITGEEADAGTKQFSFQTPFGTLALKWVEESKRVNATDGVEYTAPAHYVGNFGYPTWLIDVANKNVDFSAVPSSSDVAAAKKKVA